MKKNKDNNITINHPDSKGVSAEGDRGKIVCESEDKYQILFETINWGIVFQDDKGNIISANRAAEKILGLTMDQMLGRTSMHPEWRSVAEDKTDLPGERHPAMMALQTGKNVDNFIQGIYNPNLKDYVWILVNSIPLYREGESKPYQIYSTFIDISDRKQAEESLMEAQAESLRLLQQSDKSRRLLLSVVEDEKRSRMEVKSLNNRLNDLIQAIKELSSAKSLEGIQQIVTSSAHKMTTADGTSIIFRDKDQCYYADEDAISPLWKGRRFPMSSCISGWVMLNHQTTVVTDISKDDRIPFDVYKPTFVKSLLMVPINTREPLGAIGIYWAQEYTPNAMEISLIESLADATARSIENIQLNAQLEERVRLRTRELEAANKELETFTYSVSHDLKAPLRGIDGYSKLLNDLYGKSLNEEAGHFISTIRSSTLQMNQLIEDLLQYSRLERSQLQIRPLTINTYVDAVLKMHEEDLRKGGYTVEKNIPQIQIIADPNGIQIALRNLIGNAVKFSNNVPHPEITIALEEKQDSWIISVKDNGVGFDMKYSKRIFEIFQRLQRAEDYSGTGIGLAMVAKAMQRMHGEVWAQSAPGEGATFFLKLIKPTDQ